MIREALGSNEAIDKIASQSYLHRNGFSKITIKNSNGEKHRLHVYKVGAKAELNIHNHRWDFQSTILCGRLPMYLYEVIEGNTHHLHIYRRIDGTYTITFVKKVGIIESPLIEYVAGQMYEMPNNLHHRIGLVRELTITHMVTRKTDQDTCDLINIENKSSYGEEVTEQPLTREQVVDNLNLILNRINKPLGCC